MNAASFYGPELAYAAFDFEMAIRKTKYIRLVSPEGRYPRNGVSLRSSDGTVMTPYPQSYDEANRARYLAEDQRNNAASAARSQGSAQVSQEVQARKSAEARAGHAEAKVTHLKEVLRFVRDYHVHSMPSAASSAEELCCEFCRQIDEALSL